MKIVYSSAEEMCIRDRDKMQYNYDIIVNAPFNRVKLQEMGVSMEDINSGYRGNNCYVLPLTVEMVEKIKKMSNVLSVTREEEDRLISVSYTHLPSQTLYRFSHFPVSN